MKELLPFLTVCQYRYINEHPVGRGGMYAGVGVFLDIYQPLYSFFFVFFFLPSTFHAINLTVGGLVLYFSRTSSRRRTRVIYRLLVKLNVVFKNKKKINKHKTKILLRSSKYINKMHYFAKYSVFDANYCHHPATISAITKNVLRRGRWDAPKSRIIVRLIKYF